MDSYEINYNRFTKLSAISSRNESNCHKKTLSNFFTKGKKQCCGEHLKSDKIIFEH